MSKQNITIVGAGYVGYSLAILLCKNNKVTILENDNLKVDKINSGISVLNDVEIQNYLNKEEIKILATLDKKTAYENTDFVIISTPTDLDINTDKFNTTSVDQAVDDAFRFNKNSFVVIKSTLPVGHTKKLQKKYKTENIIFSPEFLREGHSLHDNLYPSRIVIGSTSNKANKFAELLKTVSKKQEVNILRVGSDEAEAIKLFSNSYLAMRVSFFNELDSFAAHKNLNSKHIIDGVSSDTRIGDHYNNPSFGYGGYCLPKDTKQLLNQFNNIPQSIFKAIVSSNQLRKNFIAKMIIDFKPSTVGFYRLVMKKNSDNFRSSAVNNLISIIQSKGIKVIIFEPNTKDDFYLEAKIIKDLDTFKKLSDVIVTNRNSKHLDDVSDKCFSRDIYGIN